jgi:hypothetical protein
MTRWLWLAGLAGCMVDNALYLPEQSGTRPVDLLPPVIPDIERFPDLTQRPPDLTSVPDLAQVRDLTSVDFGGVACGASTCGASLECCFTPATGAMCVNPGSCPDGGIAATCDGPEDCTSGQPDCCATLSGTLMSIGGTAQCTATCDGSLMLTAGNGVNLRTKLCHSDDDCAGYSGDFSGNTLPWDTCCHNTNSGIHFCASSLFAGTGGVTCP